jgi:Ser/Thr protein kinase RdoA (MazF antagonist)
MEVLDGFENFIYAFQRDGRDYILRVAHSERRSEALICGEVDWINYLYRGGLSVARAMPSPDGRLVEVVDDGHGGQFLATSFARAPGGPVWQAGGWNEALWERYGRLLGRMHRLTKRYKLAESAWRRPEWDAPGNIDLRGWLPDDQFRVVEKGIEVVEKLRRLPKKDYGLIHQDAHAGNFYVDQEGQITLFDFDDCVYGWFIYDIAMVIFYAVTNHPEPDAQAAELWPPFWRGYQAENALDLQWLRELPAFFKLREIDLYAVIHRSFEVESITNEWVAQFMDGRRQRIQEDVPYLEFEFLPVT